jgi:hypothetical protein
MSESRIPVSIEELCTAIRLWIRASPRYIWKTDELYEKLKAEKRHDPSRAPDPQGDLAAYITDRFARQDWQVTRPEPDVPGSPPPWSGDR